MSRTPADNLTMGLEPWNPTPAQEQAALALCDSSIGGRVRSHSDRTAELRTIDQGAYRRYVIDRDGTATLVESAPRPPRYAWSIAITWLGLALVFIVSFALLLVDNVGLARHEPDDFWAALVLGSGIVIFVVGMGLHPHGESPPGERWQLIGGAED